MKKKNKNMSRKKKRKKMALELELFDEFVVGARIGASYLVQWTATFRYKH